MNMIFIDHEITNLIEIMVNHHISGNYQEVRKIILGEYLSKTMVEDVYFKEFKRPNLQTFQKKGMTFYDGEVYENIRILVDENTRRILEVLFTISKNVIEYRLIIDIIIAEWIKNGIKLPNNMKNLDENRSESMRPYGIEVREDLWKDIKRISKNNELNIPNIFKQAVIQFLEDRSGMLEKQEKIEYNRALQQ